MSNTLSSIPIFAPTQISGCQLWLDAADATTVTQSGGTVSAVTDKSTNSKSLSGGSGFTYPNNIFNGTYPSFYNASSTSSLLGSNASFSLSQPVTAFVVGQSLLGSGAFGALIDGAVSPIYFSYYNSGGLRVRLYAGSEIQYTGAASTFINSYYANSTSSQIFVNGTSVVTGNIGSSALTSIIIGNANGSTTGFVGHICEVILYNSILSLAQRQQVEGYLGWKWGLQGSLPSDHPYKNSPIYPTTTLPVPFRSNLASIPLGPSLSPFSFFNPVSIPTCQLWLDAADTSTITASGGAVSQWNDKSGNGKNATQATAGNRPTYTIDSGYPSILFTRSSGQYMTGPSILTSTSYTIFIIYRTTDVASTQYVFFDYKKDTAASNGQNFVQLVLASNLVQPFIYYGLTPSTTYKLNNTPATSTNRVMVGMRDSPSNTTQNFYFNGSVQTTTWLNGGISNTTADDYGYTLGALRTTTVDTSNAFNGFINEVIVYLTELNDSQRQQVEGYLAWKWGIPTSLPSNQPYKNSPPGLTIPVVPTNRQMSTRGFNPLGLSGLSIWYDGSDPNGNGSLPSNGANISTWVDKSGNGKNATTSASYPIFSASSQNGLGTIRFNGNSGTVNYIDIPVFNFGTATRTAIFMIRNTGPGSGAGSYPLWFWPNTGNGTNALSLTGWIDVANQGTAFEIQYVATKNTYLIIIFRFGITAGFEELFINGTRVATATKSIGGTSYANADSGYRLGWLNVADPNTNYYFDGNMGEIFLTSTAISNTQRQNIEGYLAWKWNLVSSLPANHPYKLFPPPPS